MDDGRTIQQDGAPGPGEDELPETGEHRIEDDAIASDDIAMTMQPFPRPVSAGLSISRDSGAGRDSLGCTASILADQHDLAVGGWTVYRRRSQAAEGSTIATDASDRGYLIGVSMAAGHRRTVFRPCGAQTSDYGAGSVYVRPFADDYRAEVHSAFDFVLLELSGARLDELRFEGSHRRRGLIDAAGRNDPVLFHLSCALLPSLTEGACGASLFVSQVMAAVECHLVQQYSDRAATASRCSPKLSRRQEMIAKAMMADHATDTLTVAQIAETCRLSRGYFTRAFKASTGLTPHRWLQDLRVERAMALLRDGPLSLAEIAASCGFADQSHFGRVFRQRVGVPPDKWRRRRGMPAVPAS